MYTCTVLYSVHLYCTVQCTHNLLYVIPELPQGGAELHHVLRDGVEILQSAVDVAGALVQVQGVVQDDFVTGGGDGGTLLLT